jgi:septal ring factor EnvC (AmiA/AmiB activator)
MFSFVGKALKVGVMSALLLGLAGAGAFALMGKHRTKAVVHELQDNLLESIDAHLDNPELMRTQLRDLEREYPERIAQVQSDLAEIKHEIRELDQEIQVSDRVVALAEQDLGRFETQVSSQIPREAGAQLAAVRLDGAEYTPDEAHSQLERIRATRAAYVHRAADARHDLGYLTKQAGRLEELLARLQGEQTEFRVQVQGLNRQIDAIARNERLIGLLEKRNKTIEECSQYETVSLDQITSRLDQVKGKQEAALDLLASEERATDYEELARSQIATEELRSPEPLARALSDTLSGN